MANLMQMRLAAREIFEEALRAVDPAAALRENVRLDPSQLYTDFELKPDSRICSVAIGKAAPAMAAALDALLGERLWRAVIASSALNDDESRLSNRWTCFRGGHPLPNESSLAAAQAAFELIDNANQSEALVIFLVSGGGSASIEWPINDDISLADLRLANKVLVNSGASINEINSVRRAFSAIKGGRLAARATACKKLTLLVSDVRRGDEHNIASGPTMLPPSGDFEALEVIRHYNLEAQLPSSILDAVENPQPLPELPGTKRDLLLDNESALDAAVKFALDEGFWAEKISEVTDQAIDAGCRELLARLAEAANAYPLGRVRCLVSGGEFACPVRGDGIGGRNLETALRLAILADQNRERVGEFVALCAGTDGIDGNSPAAGAIVDSTTIERAQRIGLAPQDFLNRSDSYSFFVALGDAITTGPTGTNVRDLRILMAGRT